MSQLQKRKTILLKPGRERSVQRRHPWIFSGAIAGVQGEPEPGDTVEVLSGSGAFLAWAAYSPQSQIRARVWSWAQDETIDKNFLYRQIWHSVQKRLDLPQLMGYPTGIEREGRRLVYAESDGLPGVIADLYADTLVVQLLSAGAEYWRVAIVESLATITGCARIFERSDVDVRALEGLPERAGLLHGEPLSGPVIIVEPGDGYSLQFEIDIERGHKTASYLDQRVNRRLVGRLAKNKDILDCFAYTGGFTLHCAAGGAASILAVDTSAEALEAARRNYALNSLPVGKVEWQEADVFAALRTLRDARRSFDLVILDPPKFAQTASQAERAARGYKDINLLAFKLLRPGGILATFSCSGGVSEDLFQKIVAGAALDAGVQAQILERLSQAPDHPVALNFPEAAYLKGFIIKVGKA